jgi:Ca2+-binding RTX toxin-like protein
MFGGPGADQIFGQRGNDTLHGEGGADALYGGIGDDTGFGNDGFDLLAGGLGTDTLDGNENGDIIRGDGTVDVLKDTGASGDDTVSFATAVVPGFTGTIPVAGFPAEGNGEERGVYIRMDGAPAPCGTPSCNSDARYGGGGDEIKVSGFETVIGSPFADYYLGSDERDRFFGGGGTDVMIGNGGDDAFYGGAQSDFMNGGAGSDIAFSQAGINNCSADVEYRNQCAGTAEEVHPRDRSKISVGYQTTTLLRRGFLWEPYYMVGSESADNVSVRYVNTDSPDYQIRDYLIFSTEPGSAEFDTSDDARVGCEYKPSEVKCPFFRSSKLGGVDAITLAGMAGDDQLSIAPNGTAWEVTTTPVLLGGQGNDTLIGSGQTEDVLVDGDGVGNDTLYGFGFDDALLNNEGFDKLQAGLGSDLLLSATTCGGDILQGAEGKTGDKEDVNNASWAALPAASGGVVADLRRKTAGGQYAEPIATSEAEASGAKGGDAKGGGGDKGGGDKGGRPTGGPACASGSVDHLYNIDDLEASSQNDALYGDASSNNLLGRKGEDILFGRAGDDRIAAKDGEHDNVGGGGGEDLCIFDEGLDTLDSCNP